MAFGGLKGTLTANGASTTASNSLTGSVVVAVGDLVWVAFGEENVIFATTVSDNLGNTYTALNAGTDAGITTLKCYWSRVTVAGTLTSVAVAASATTNNWAGVVAVIEGPFATSPLDANPANTTADITSPFTCPATGTLAQADEVVMCSGVRDVASAWSATSPNLKALEVTTQINPSVVVGYQLVAATTTVSPEFTAAANPTADVLTTASFKKDIALPKIVQINQSVQRAAYW
jgi:hypothetical protein